MHEDDVQDALNAMLALAPPQAPAAAPPEPAVTPVAAVPVAAAVEAPVAPLAAVRGEAPRRQPPSPPAPRRAAPAPGVRPPDAPNEEGLDPRRNVKVPASMDRDLIELVGLARKALSLTWGQVVIRAASAYRLVAADLPDTPEMSTVVDDYYGEVSTEAHHRVITTFYMRAYGLANLKRDADEAGMSLSSFVRRVLRAFLTVDKVFIPAEDLARLQSPAGVRDVIRRLQSHAETPAHALPPTAGRLWLVSPLSEGTPLREALDIAQETMPGCRSATQALLTVLAQ